VYRDALGRKGSSQSFVSITDKPETERMMALANNAAYFEKKAPWPDEYKRTVFTKPVVKAVETLIETGDFDVTTIGDNLPNENVIHQKYGTKNFLFVPVTHAFDHVSNGAVLREFGSSPAEIARDEKFGDEAEDLMTALHEVIGHGSGKLSPRLKNGAEPYLKQYFSTLEEARADLMALWNVWDPKLKQLGLISNQEEVAKAMYDQAAREALTQLERVPKGDSLEEDHLRDRQMIVRYIMATTGGIEQFNRDGKTYIRVTDYQKMRQGVGQLLDKLMVIKATGDFNAIQQLVEKYGMHFDPKLRDQVAARYKKLGLPNAWAGINSRLTAQFGANGKIERVEISYPAEPKEQYMSYASMYDKGLAGASGAR
jgi:dipeptidyl-peptidase-3